MTFFCLLQAASIDPTSPLHTYMPGIRRMIMYTVILCVIMIVLLMIRLSVYHDRSILRIKTIKYIFVIHVVYLVATLLVYSLVIGN